MWFDLDRIEDLDRLQTLAEPGVGQAMRRTMALLQQLNH
jgi:hypothetical protein